MGRRKKGCGSRRKDARNKKQEGNNAYLHLWTLSRPTDLSLKYGVVTDGRMDGLEMEKKEIERENPEREKVLRGKKS